jgi:hypothetical protein
MPFGEIIGEYHENYMNDNEYNGQPKYININVNIVRKSRVASVNL